MDLIDWRRELNRHGHRVVILGQPIAMHCHHYNINLQKTLEDSLGEEGVRLLYLAVEDTNYHGLKNIFDQLKRIKTIKSKLEMASILYQNCGLGIIHFNKYSPHKAQIESPSSHHVTGWLAKHGRRDTPGCHFARGWIAGAFEATYKRPLGYYAVEETRCKMQGDDVCVFDVKEK